MQNNSISKADDYYRFWLRFRKQSKRLLVWGRLNSRKTYPSVALGSAGNSTPRVKSVPQEEAHYAHQKPGEVRQRGRGWVPSAGRKIPITIQRSK